MSDELDPNEPIEMTCSDDFFSATEELGIGRSLNAVTLRRSVPLWALSIWRVTHEGDDLAALALARDSPEHRAALLSLIAADAHDRSLPGTRDAVRAYLASIAPPGPT